MTAIAVTAAQVSLVDPEEAEVFDGVALVAITAGQPVYFDPTTGKLGIADANDAGKEQVRGIALKTVGIGQGVSYLKRGRLYGFTISGLSFDDFAYLSDTAGGLDTSAGTKTVRVARVVPDAATPPNKVLYVDSDWRSQW